MHGMPTYLFFQGSERQIISHEYPLNDDGLSSVSDIDIHLLAA
jgi:hypothetical protein